MNKINSFIEKYIEKILIIFLMLQPIMDSITAICMNYLNINITVSSIIRLLFLIFCIYYLIVLDNTKNKKNNIKYLIIILIYFILFTITTIYVKDIHVLSFEIKNMLNTFYLPIILISLIDIFKQYKISFKLKNIIIVYMTYVALVLIPNLTNTGFLSYSHSKDGQTGWFISANAIGNILSILIPFIFLYLINSKLNKYLKLLISISVLYVFLSMGTKVPVLSLIICIIINFIYYIIKWYKDKKNNYIAISLISIIILIICSFVVVPKTTFYKNIETHKQFLKINNYSEIFTNYNLLDHFIFSQRLTFLKDTNSNYLKASSLEKLFGLGYIEAYATDKVSTKTIEIDYFEVFYRSGIIGFILYFSIIIPVLFKSIRKIKNNSLINLEYKTSILLIILLALFSGHILVTPAVSIYVAFIFTLMNNKLDIKD